MDNFLPFQEARENGGITEVPSGKHTKKPWNITIFNG
jgi:hypothetical protein